MSNRNPCPDDGGGTAPWSKGNVLEGYPQDDSAEVELGFFAGFVKSDGLPGAHQNALPTTTTTTVSPDQYEPTQITSHPNVANSNTESNPAPDSADIEDGAESPRGKKKRRGRNPPELEYSQMVLELNKKRKRTGQACDRCKVRGYKCDPSPTGCINCQEVGMVCKLTDCVTGEPYVRRAAGRMAAEIEELNARVTNLERENQELQRNIKPHYIVEHTTIPHQEHQRQPLSLEQEILNLRAENSTLRQRLAIVYGNNHTLRERVQEQDEMLRLPDGVELYNAKYNWAV